MKLVTPSAYLLIIALFFFSFCDFSCSGVKLTSLRGIDMVTGTQVNTSAKDSEFMSSSVKTDVPAVFWADLSFGMAVIGLSVFLIMASAGRLGSGRVVYIVSSVVGAISQFAIKIHLDNELGSKQKMNELGVDFNIIQVTYTPAFWGVLGLFVLIVIVNALPNYKIIKEEPEPDFQKLGNIE